MAKPPPGQSSRSTFSCRRAVALTLWRVRIQPFFSRAEADAAFAELKRKFADARTVIAEIYTYRGEFDRAFAALDAAFNAGDPELFGIKTDHFLIPLHADPRYRALLRKLNLPEEESG